MRFQGTMPYLAQVGVQDEITAERFFLRNLVVGKVAPVLAGIRRSAAKLDWAVLGIGIDQAKRQALNAQSIYGPRGPGY